MSYKEQIPQTCNAVFDIYLICLLQATPVSSHSRISCTLWVKICLKDNDQALSWPFLCVSLTHTCLTLQRSWYTLFLLLSTNFSI